MNRFFLILSGEHQTLPVAEVAAIMQIGEITWKDSRLVGLSSSQSTVVEVLKRAAYTQECASEIFKSSASEPDILANLKSCDFSSFLGTAKRFSVRIRNLHHESDLNLRNLERIAGKIILQSANKWRVDLLKPEIEFLGAASKTIFALGVRVRRHQRENFQQRTPRKKLFFHPASLHPKIARCLVNLSRPLPNSAILDPFCGTGTILIEAGLMGFEPLGGDILMKMAKGSKINLNYFEVSKSHIAVWDALRLPLTHIGRIVTNPPYGRSTSTKGLNPNVLIDSFLRTITCGEFPRTIVVALPFTTRTNDKLDRNGLKIYERHLVYVHKSLTREILVLTQQ